jgi:hypothetical protein
MSFPTTCLCWALTLAVSTTLLQASLVWDSPTQELRADFGQEEVPVAFAFKNTGTASITIENIAVSCGCTATALARKTYASGERGELEVVYRPDGQTGLQAKTIAVTTSDQPDQPVTLTLRVDVPRLFDIAPRLLTWPLGGEAVEKPVTITLHRTPQTTVSIVDPDQEHVHVMLRPGDKPGVHTLLLRPKSTATAFRATVRLKIESDGLQPQILAVYADLR